jgi:hypothetical protein
MDRAIALYIASFGTGGLGVCWRSPRAGKEERDGLRNDGKGKKS